MIEAEGADAAVAILRNGAKICAVVTDVKMPSSMDGLGLASWMRDQAPRVPIIITSGFATEPDCETLNPAITCVVLKPYSACKCPPSPRYSEIYWITKEIILDFLYADCQRFADITSQISQ
ncbi:MAG: response regulator [Sphingomonas bacterium]|nr:response regulator [Sphingomonas bacterium]